MKLRDIIGSGGAGQAWDNFRQSLILDNLNRGLIFAKVIIGLEAILAAVDVISSALKVNAEFRFSAYLFAYLLMILFNVAFVIVARAVTRRGLAAGNAPARVEAFILAYVTLIMLWGAGITLMDQKLYGQLTAFMVNMVVCSLLFYFENKKFVIPYVISVGTMGLGLPFFQHSVNILIGDYVNLAVFVLISWVSSRIMYFNYCSDFHNKALLNEANRKLERLSFFDELTSLPNRRSYTGRLDEISASAPSKGVVYSVIMMDIDYFKQFNDLYGHNAGDDCLTQVAAQIHAAVRGAGDFAARIGGEEFIFLAADTTPGQIERIAEDIRQNVFELQIPHLGSTHAFISLSLGTATFRVTGRDTLQNGIEAADKALYLAKGSGRNCVRSRNEEP